MADPVRRVASVAMGSIGWLRLELRYLAALEAIADEGSFGRAADQLGYTQSAVSQQIAALESIVGARLIERPPGHRTAALTTPVSCCFATHARSAPGSGRRRPT
jgi:DNA-binding transcriptional LysR family regulator